MSAVLLAALTLCACSSPRGGGFDSPVPGARIDAIEAAVIAWRTAPPASRTVPPATRRGLVESLRATDPLVRFLAAEALHEMTGERRGYRYDDPPALRTVAIDAWLPWASGDDARGAEVSS